MQTHEIKRTTLEMLHARNTPSSLYDAYLFDIATAMLESIAAVVPDKYNNAIASDACSSEMILLNGK
jgi:hypothetical protein